MNPANVSADPAEPVTDDRNERVKKACEFLGPYYNHAETALVLGTGLAEIAGQLSHAQVFSYHDIPGFSVSDVPFHPARLHFGTWVQNLCVMQGRYHLYEGLGFADVVFPIDVLSEIGIKKLILTHAAGSIRKHLLPGSLACIRDHINLTGELFAVFPQAEQKKMFTDLKDMYHSDFCMKAAEHINCVLHPVVLGCISGPALPTEAEIGMFRKMGVDVVGMSTAPEAVRARQLGMHVLALTIVTDQSLPGTMQNVSGREIRQVAETQRPALKALLKQILTEIDYL